jgi:hypothetical protein
MKNAIKYALSALALAALAAGCSGAEETAPSAPLDIPDDWCGTVPAEAAKLPAPEPASDIGSVQEAISTFDKYGRGQSPTHTSADNQCYSDSPVCTVPLDRVLNFKLDVGVPPFEFSRGLQAAIDYIHANYPNWTVDTTGTDSGQRIFFDHVCGTPCTQPGLACVLARDEPGSISAEKVQAGWHYKTIGKDSIRICDVAMGQAMQAAGVRTEAGLIQGWRNLLLHEISHTMGLAHNPQSSALQAGVPFSFATQHTLLEQIELLSYDPNG